MRRDIRLIGTALAVLAAAGCALPRGGPVEREIVTAGESGYQDFAVYPVTRDFLSVAADWPLTGEPHYRWITASQGASSQLIRAGDTVQLRIWDSSENSLLTGPEAPNADLGEIRVAPNGTIFVPYVGDVSIGGMTPQRAREVVQRALEAITPSAQVQISLIEGRGNSVDLVGGVGAPGSYPMPDRNFTVLSLISAAGGVSAGLDNPQIRLIRGGQIYGTSIARLYAEPQLDTRLRGGDRVIVEADRRYFLSLGATGAEAQHVFTQDVITALDALAITGGVNDSRADPGGVLILRQYPASAVQPGQPGPRATQVVFSIDLTTAEGLFAARNFRVNPGDLVLGTESPLTSTQTIFGLIGSAFGLVGQVGRVGD